MEVKSAKNRKYTIEKASQFGGFPLPYIKNYYKTTIIKKLWYWCKYRYIDQSYKTAHK